MVGVLIPIDILPFEFKLLNASRHLPRCFRLTLSLVGDRDGVVNFDRTEEAFDLIEPKASSLGAAWWVST